MKRLVTALAQGPAACRPTPSPTTLARGWGVGGADQLRPSLLPAVHLLTLTLAVVFCDGSMGASLTLLPGRTPGLSHFRRVASRRPCLPAWAPRAPSQAGVFLY